MARLAGSYTDNRLVDRDLASSRKKVDGMKGFVKFVSIMAFGVFCFIGGVARGDGKNHVAAYCVGGGVWFLLNGYAAVLEMDNRELFNNMSNKRTGCGKKSKSL